MQRSIPPKIVPPRDVTSREAVRQAVTDLYGYLAALSKYLDRVNADVVSELTPVYAELGYATPSAIASTKQRILTATVPNVILGYATDLSYDKDLQGIQDQVGGRNHGGARSFDHQYCGCRIVGQRCQCRKLC